jgi:hypothetical protein
MGLLDAAIEDIVLRYHLTMVGHRRCLWEMREGPFERCNA